MTGFRLVDLDLPSVQATRREWGRAGADPARIGADPARTGAEPTRIGADPTHPAFDRPVKVNWISFTFFFLFSLFSSVDF